MVFLPLPCALAASAAFLFLLPMSREYDDRRGSSTARGYDSRWQRARAAYLRLHPLCQCPACQEGAVRVRAALIVDHKVAPRIAEAIASGDKAALLSAQRLFWDQSNWQALSKQCHDSWKQRLEKSGKVVGATEKGIPLDPNHHWRRGGAG